MSPPRSVCVTTPDLAPEVIRRERFKRRVVESAALDKNISISKISQINPPTALAATLKYPLDAVLAFNHADIADADEVGIVIVTFPYTGRRERAVGRGS